MTTSKFSTQPGECNEPQRRSNYRSGSHGAIERGPRIGTKTKAESFAQYPENVELVASLHRLYRIERVVDYHGQPTEEWNAIGRSGMIAECGIGKLCVTAIGGKLVPFAKRQFAGIAVSQQEGEGEANFILPWTPQNLALAAGIVKLFKTKSGEKNKTSFKPQAAEGCRVPGASEAEKAV